MKSKLLLFATLFLFVFSTEAQSVGFLGDFSGWGDDVDMTVSGFPTYVISGYYLPNTGLKFRQDDSWDTNWGGDTFPTGTYSTGNIPVVAGFYDISIDISSTAYAFTSVAPSDQMVSVIGDFNGWSSDLMLSTSDFVNYTATNVALTTGGLKFRRNNNWSVNYGGTTLSGFGVPGSVDNIPIPTDGNYDIAFNIETFAYSIVTSTLSIESDEEQIFDIRYFDGKVRIQGFNGDADLLVYDFVGRQVQSLRNLKIQNNMVFDLALPKGQMFILQFKSENVTKTLKVVSN